MSAPQRPRPEGVRSFFRTPPAWLITVALFLFSIVTIALAIAGQ